MIQLVEKHFRGKSRKIVNEEMADFCKEHNLQERDVRTAITKIYTHKLVKARIRNNIKILSKLKPVKVEKPKPVIPKPELPKTILVEDSPLKQEILKTIKGMSRTQAYKCWRSFRKLINSKDFRLFVQENVHLSERFYECEALRLPKVVKPQIHVGKKKMEQLQGYRLVPIKHPNSLPIVTKKELIMVRKKKGQPIYYKKVAA
jgi:hypothetical protein